MRKLGAVNDANYCNYMERKLWAWYRRFPHNLRPKQAAADSAADVAADIAAPAEAEGSAPAADAAVESLLMSDGEKICMDQPEFSCVWLAARGGLLYVIYAM
jgi:hypothetical protein